MNLRPQQILKQKKVQEIKELVINNNIFFLVAYQNMKVADVQNWKSFLYKQFGPHNRVILKIYKKTLLKRALLDTPYIQMNNYDAKNFFVVTGKVESLSLIKVFAKFLKEKPKTSFLAGVCDQEFYSGRQMQELASLPTKEELIGKLILSLNFIPLNLLLTLKEISSKATKTEKK